MALDLTFIINLKRDPSIVTMREKSDIVRQRFGRDNIIGFEALHLDDEDRENERLPSPEECIKTAWPYYAPAHTLPAPLPTIEDIEKVAGSENDFTRNKLGLGDGFVFRVNDVFVVKFCAHIDIMRVSVFGHRGRDANRSFKPQEMESMLFLEQNSNVRIPKLYAAYTQYGDPLGLTSDNPPRWSSRYTRDELPPYHFLVMEYIEGCTLREKWTTLQEQEKIDVSKTIGSQLLSLRSIPSSGYYGRVHYQPFVEEAGLLKTRHKRPLGPYDTYSDIASAMAEAGELYIAKRTRTTGFHLADQLIIDHLRSAYANCDYSEPKFTHGDLHFDNIQIKTIAAKRNDGRQEYEVVLIDWARAAWYPAWVEAEGVLSECPVDDQFQPFKDMSIWRYYVAQGFKQFPHRDAVYLAQIFHETGIRF